MDFLAQAKGPWCVEIFGAMDRDTVAGTAEEMSSEKRDIG